MNIIIAIILVLLLFGALPMFPYSAGWGYRPVSIGTVVVVLILLFLFGVI